jgi:hypothetical protein
MGYKRSVTNILLLNPSLIFMQIKFAIKSFTEFANFIFSASEPISERESPAKTLPASVPVNAIIVLFALEESVLGHLSTIYSN